MPRYTSNPKDKTLKFRLNEYEATKIEEEAKRKGTTVSKILRQCVSEHLRKQT